MPPESAFSGRQVSADRSRPRESVSACRPEVPMSAAVRRADATIRAIPALFLQKDGGDERWLLEGDTRRDDGGGWQSVEWSFDTLKHAWLVQFIEHRVADKRIVRLIQKWLSAGVLEDGKRIQSEVGTVQGGSVSPLLANISSVPTLIE